MLKPKKKMTKHNLKEDKFVKTTLQMKTYLDENSSKVMSAVFGIVIIIVIVIIIRHTSQQTREEATGQLGIAQIEFNNANYTKASSRLLRLIEDYDGTEEAEQGMFLLANIYFQQYKYDKASSYFEEFINSYSRSELLLASGYAGLAACREIEKKYEDAADLYKNAANIAADFTESDNYSYLAGICFKKADLIEKAKSQFENIMENSKSPDRKKDAESQLVMLGKEK